MNHFKLIIWKIKLTFKITNWKIKYEKRLIFVKINHFASFNNSGHFLKKINFKSKGYILILKFKLNNWKFYIIFFVGKESVKNEKGQEWERERWGIGTKTVRNGNGNGQERERERSGTGTGTVWERYGNGKERNGNGKERNGNGKGTERERNGERHGNERITVVLKV